ncbi:10522_t:CDS:2, partial [Scutellospora calospora]
IKFTDNGNVELTTVEITDEVETNQDDKKKISSSSEGRNSESSSVKFRIEVIDTGRGIDPGFMNNMCQPFSQEDSSLRTKFEGTGLGLSLLDMMHSHLEVKSAVGAGSKFSFVLELPLSQRLESIVPSQFPLDYKYLQLSIEEQNLLISKSQSLSFAILKSENTLFLRQITYYLDQWGFKYRLINKDELKVEFEKEHADIIILNDSVSNLECFLDKLEQFHEAVKVNDENVKNAELEHMNERKQKILFFSTIEDHQNAENALQKHKVQFAVPAGPVKILTAIIKAIESLHSPTAENICVIKEDTTSCNHAQKREICLGNELLLSPSIHGSAADMIEEFSIGVSEKILMSSVYDNTIRTKLAEVELIEERSSTVDGIDEKNMHLITGEEKEIKKKKALKDITFLIVE